MVALQGELEQNIYALLFLDLLLPDESRIRPGHSWLGSDQSVTASTSPDWYRYPVNDWNVQPIE